MSSSPLLPDAAIDARSMFTEAGAPQNPSVGDIAGKSTVMVPAAVNTSIDVGPDDSALGTRRQPGAASPAAQDSSTPLTEGPVDRPTSPNL